MSEWEIEVLDNDRTKFGIIQSSGLEIREKYIKDLEDSEPHTLIKCPVCNERESMFIALNEKKLFEEKKLHADYGMCKHCDVNFPPKFSPILMDLCNPVLSEELARSILKMYGADGNN